MIYFLELSMRILKFMQQKRQRNFRNKKELEKTNNSDVKSYYKDTKLKMLYQYKNKQTNQGSNFLKFINMPKYIWEFSTFNNSGIINRFFNNCHLEQNVIRFLPLTFYKTNYQMDQRLKYKRITKILDENMGNCF